MGESLIVAPFRRCDEERHACDDDDFEDPVGDGEDVALQCEVEDCKVDEQRNESNSDELGIFDGFKWGIVVVILDVVCVHISDSFLFEWMKVPLFSGTRSLHPIHCTAVRVAIRCEMIGFVATVVDIGQIVEFEYAVVEGEFDDIVANACELDADEYGESRDDAGNDLVGHHLQESRLVVLPSAHQSDNHHTGKHADGDVDCGQHIKAMQCFEAIVAIWEHIVCYAAGHGNEFIDDIVDSDFHLRVSFGLGAFTRKCSYCFSVGASAHISLVWICFLFSYLISFYLLYGCWKSFVLSAAGRRFICMFFAVFLALNAMFTYSVCAGRLTSDTDVFGMREAQAQDIEVKYSVVEEPELDSVLEKRFDAAMQNLTTNVYVEDVGLSQNAMMDQMTLYLDLHPDVFWVDSVSVYYSNATGNAETVVFNFAWSKDSVSSMRERYEATVAKIVAKADECESTEDQLRYVHDTIIDICDYDNDAVNNLNEVPFIDGTSYGALVVGNAVCSGYAAAYQDICSRLGIECEQIMSEDMNHEWNIVNIDGVWRHVDVTWDEPSALSYFQGASDKYFLLTDKEVAQGRHYSWETYHKCS